MRDIISLNVNDALSLGFEEEAMKAQRKGDDIARLDPDDVPDEQTDQVMEKAISFTIVNWDEEWDQDYARKFMKAFQEKHQTLTSGPDFGQWGSGDSYVQITSGSGDKSAQDVESTASKFGVDL